MKWKNILATICATVLVSSTALSAGQNDSLSELKADEIDYDMDSGIMTAVGGVSVNYDDKTKNSNVPSEVNADTVDYDMNSGVVTANGNVFLKYGDDTATGGRAMYNVNTQESYLYDNVVINRADLKITCNSIRNFADGHMQASGNVYAIQTIKPSAKYPRGDTRTFIGEYIDYYPDDKKHFYVPNGGRLTGNDGEFTANQMEGWLDDEYYIGIGNVHIVNPPREMEAGGDRIDYYASENGKAILTGNAWIHQKNNTMRGNRLTVYLSENQNNYTPITTTPAKTITPHETVTKK